MPSPAPTPISWANCELGTQLVAAYRAAFALRTQFVGRVVLANDANNPWIKLPPVVGTAIMLYAENQLKDAIIALGITPPTLP